MSEKKPEADEATDTKLCDCLACRRPFLSAWVGERICPKCKTSSAWRTGVAPKAVAVG